VPYSACAHRLDERSHAAGLASEITLPQLALSLARAKALSLGDEFADAHILASDQIAEIEGSVLHKPGTRDKAIEQLSRLQGREHRLLTALALRLPGGEVLTSLDTHTMVMRPLTNSEISRYVDLEQPLDCCGSYKIESLGISLFASIVGDDFTAITGLPLLALSKLLRKAGFAIP
jgi:septum formation protein